jgi:integrase
VERGIFRILFIFFSKKGVAMKSATVKTLLDLYIARKGFSGANLRSAKYHLATVLAEFGGREAASIGKRDLLAFIKAATDRGVKTTTSHRRLTILRAAFSWATEEELLSANPIAGVRLPAGRSERIAPPSYAETRALLGSARGHLRRVILLGVFIGARIGPSELFRLRWTDVDFDRQSIRVWSAAKSRSRAYRDVPIRRALLADLRGWADEDRGAGMESVISWRGKPVAGVKGAWKKCLERAGILRRIRPYDLRHAFATYALDSGADINAVADIMGHSNVATLLAHYRHTGEAVRRAAVESFPDVTRPAL